MNVQEEKQGGEGTPRCPGYQMGLIQIMRHLGSAQCPLLSRLFHGPGTFLRPEEILMDFVVIEPPRAGVYILVHEDSGRR